MNSLIVFLKYLGKFVEDGATGMPSVKRFGLALAITVLTFVMLVMGLVICIVTYNAAPQYSIEMVRIIANSLEVISGMVLTAVTTGYLVGKRKSKDEIPSNE